MLALPINEIFETIQGEASFTGTPSVFVRLQGCGVGCPWCDTKHTWRLAPADVIPVSEMLRKDGDASTYAEMGIDELLATIQTFRAGHVVITGGEPCDHPLRELTFALLATGRSVQIETSGTSPIDVAAGTFVTVSPKIGMPGGLKIRRDALVRADEIKMPVGKPRDIAALADLLDDFELTESAACVWLQPLSQNAKATELCVEAATASGLRGWRVSLQTHKYLGVR